MSKEVKPVDEIVLDKDEFLKEYNKPHTKSSRPGVLTKREKKKFGIGKDEGRASVSHYRLAPRKVKVVIDLIRGKSLDEAYGIVKYVPKAASEILYKLLKSAEANAVNNFGLDRDSLYVSEAYANQGIILKRIMPRAKGSAYRINKRTSNITVVLKEKN